MASLKGAPTRKNSLLSYINNLKKIAGGPIEEEDLYAAGFSESDLEEIGWFAPTGKATALDSDGAKLEAYNPTSRDNVRNNVSGALRGLGLDKQLARSVAVKVAGEENPADGGLGMGLADFTPLGALFGAEEGVNAVKRGVASGNYTSAGLGALNAATSVASALPAGKAVSQGVNKIAEKLAGEYDPSVVRTFFGPNSAKADLAKLEKAKQMEAAGASVDEIWKEAGWWNGPNGWRFEVDDSDMVLPHGSTELSMYGRSSDAIAHKNYWQSLQPREELIDRDTPEFFEQSYKAQDLGYGYTTLGPMNAGRKYKGTFRDSDRSIEAYGYTPEDQKQTLVHEMQHAIQYVFGDKGTGSNPKWVSERLKETLDELPIDQRNAATNAAEFGYSTARLKEINFSISNLEERIAKEAAANEDILVESLSSSGEVPFGWDQVDTSASDKELLDALYKEQERLSADLQGKGEYLANIAKSYPNFSMALEEFKVLGEGVGTQYFASTPNFSEDLFSRTYMFKGDNELDDFAAYTLYTLDAGEVEARIAGDRANWLPEERAYYSPASDVVNKDYIYSADDLLNWLEGIKQDARKSSKKGYAKGGVVQETDPVSGNPVPPGAEPKEVRDNIDAKLSDGEYVIPADVVRYIGLDKIEKMIAQAKEGLAEMDANGRIGGEVLEPEDDLPFSDEELLSEDEPPIQMASGGLVSAGDRIRNKALNPLANTTQQLPPWMIDQGSRVSPVVPVAKESWADRQKEQTPMGMAGAVETWSAKDFSNAVKQRSGDPGAQVAEGIVRSIPFGGLAMQARNKYLDKKVPGAIDAMVKSGKDFDGTPLTEQQIADLQQAKVDFEKTVGYKPGGFAGAIKSAGKSLIKPKEKEEKKSSDKTSDKDKSDKDKSDKDKKK